MRKSSLTNRLVLTIIIPIVSVLMALGIINYFDTKSIIKQLNGAEKSYTINEIRSFIELQFVALDIIEEPIQAQMKAYSQQLVDMYANNEIDIETTNLDLVLDALGMDNKTFDLYIVNAFGEVINTTYKADLGINLYDFGEVHKNYLKNIFNEVKFDSPRFFFEAQTKKYKKYSYQATADKQYIIEIGLYSKQADRIFDYMMQRLNTIAEERVKIANIDLFFWLDAPTSLDPNKKFIENHMSILPRLELDTTVSLQSNITGFSQSEYTYTYIQNIDSKLIKGAIVRLQYNPAIKNTFRNKELLKFAGVFIIAFLLVLVIAYMVHPIGKAIKNITFVAKELAIGNLSVKINDNLKKRNDELGDLSIAIGTLISGLNQTLNFAKQTGKGNFNEEYKLLSNKDELGKTLMTMQESLTKAKVEEEKIKEEEQKNKFIADGLAKFSEILRSNNNNINTLCFSTIKNLVDYLDLPMGAIYVKEELDGKIIFDSKATIAYDRQRLTENKVKLKDGLVGRCAYEKLPIYLKEIPQDYVNITTGLGTSNPNYIFLVPLLYENEVYGVIELASFNEIKDYHQLFTQHLGESIASTLSSVQLNQQTTELLEQSKKQGEELAMQEEQMRQNMEELIASQEEAELRETKLSAIVNTLDATIFRIEYDMNGFITDINENYLKFLLSSSEELVNKHISEEYNILGSDFAIQDELLSNLKNGLKQNLNIKVKIGGKKYKLLEFYYPISDQNKLIKLSYQV